MPAITYKVVVHRNQRRILVTFPPDSEWNKRMKKVPGCRWSETLQGWTIPDTEANRKRCHLEDHAMWMPSHPTQPGTNYLSPVIRLSEENRQQLFLFLQHLHLHSYSPSTIRTYRNEFLQLLQLLGNTPVDSLQPSHLQRYLLYCRGQGLTENAIHSRMNALKYYYEQVLHRDKMFLTFRKETAAASRCIQQRGSGSYLKQCG